MTNKLDTYVEAAMKAKGHSLWSTAPVVVDSARPGRAEIDGRDCLVLCSNDYLGLAADPRVIEATIRAVKRYGAGARSSRSLGGDSRLHHQLEEELADFKRVEAVLLFGSGSVCNIGVVSALMQKGDLVLSDELNHASIIDGCRLSRSEIEVYRHGDMEHLSQLLKDSPEHGKTLIVTDGVFSMSGVVSRLDEIVALAQQHEAMVMVDDAHATGVLGPTGEGTAWHFGLHGKVALQIGTLGKALGSLGGFVAGSKALIDYLAGHSRPFLYTTSLPPAAAAAALQALRILRSEQERVQRLWENARRFHAGLVDLGFQMRPDASPINPVFFENAHLAEQISRHLLRRGVYVQAVGAAYVGPGPGRLRTIVSAAHTAADIDNAIDAFAAAGRELGVIPLN